MREVSIAAGILISAFGVGLSFGLGFIHAIRWAEKKYGGLPVRLKNLTIQYIDLTHKTEAEIRGGANDEI